MSILRNKRITLRAPEPSDADLLYRWENDPEVWQVSNTLTPFSRFILEKYIESATMDIYQCGQLRLMIDLIDNQTIGTVDLFDFDAFHCRAGIGILIAVSEERRKGYAGEVLETMINYCFGNLGLHQLYCNISKNNTVSLRLFQKSGFRITGEKEDWLRSSKGWTNEYTLQLINN